MATSKKHHQSHYFEVLNLFALAIIVVTVYTLRDQMNATIVTMFTLTYFIANIAYAAKTHNLDAMRVVEVGLIALISEFLILNYLI